MDQATARRLMDETEALHEANDWSAAEALWRPYVAQNDVEAQFRLAYYYLFYSFDEEAETRAEMEKLLRTAAEQGHPDAVYWLSHLYRDGTERDALLLKAGELGSLEGQRDLGALYATGDWTGPRDAVRAAEWYRRAAERGHADAVQLWLHVFAWRGRAHRSRRGFAMAAACSRSRRRIVVPAISRLISEWLSWSSLRSWGGGTVGRAISAIPTNACRQRGRSCRSPHLRPLAIPTLRL
jgi:TPR repeat protein